MRTPRRMGLKIGFNKQVYLSLLIASAALGPYLLPLQFAGISLYAFRVLVVLAVLLILGAKQGPFLLVWNRPVKLYTLLACLWLVWGVFSLFWAPSEIDGIKEIIAVAFGLAVGFAFLLLGAYRPLSLDALRRGWVWAYCVAGLVGLWEGLSGNHLPSHYVQTAPAYVLRSTLMSTFGNPNNYSAFAVLSFPFLAWSLRLSKGLRQRLCYLVLLLSIALVLEETGSRLALVVYVLQLLLLLGFSRGRRRKTIVLVLLGLVLGVLCIGIAGQKQYFLWKKLRTLSIELNTPGGSILKRMNLVLNGLWFVYVSGGFGLGAGSYEHAVRSRLGRFPTWGVVNPHHLWIEVLSQYGVWVGIAFGFWWLFSVWTLLCARAAITDESMRTAIEATLLGSVTYVLVVAVPSSFLPLPINWVFTATVLAVSVAAWRHTHSQRSEHREGSSVSDELVRMLDMGSGAR